MADLKSGNDRLKLVQKRDCIEKINQWESMLHDRKSRLIHKKDEIAKTNGNIDASDEDLVEVNAGGEIVVAKRSTLTQIQGSEFEAIFSGRWDKKLLRDSHGRIFLDVNPTCFRAIVDHLNEMLISSEDSPPSPPNVDDEHKHILQHQLELFGIVPKVGMADSNIIKDDVNCKILLHEWLDEDDSDGAFTLLYQGSRDGLSNQVFHSNCDNKGCTLTIIELTDGAIIGGYSNTSWSCSNHYSVADKAFLFALSGKSIWSPCKMKLYEKKDPHAIFNSLGYGPAFGRGGGNGCDMFVGGSTVYLNPGRSYHPGLLPKGSYTIKEMEVFQVCGSPPPIKRLLGSHAHDRDMQIEPDTVFAVAMSEAVKASQACLHQAEAEMLQLEEDFIDEQAFIENFASGDAKDIILLNVSGIMMITTRATLCWINDSVLARQFDDSRWTEQGCNGPPVNEWTPDQVSTWARNVNGLPEEVGVMLYENEINGRELLSMSIDSLKVMGLKRIGTVALLLKEVAKLEITNRDIVTLIEHSPYCFGKILDYLRLKRLHSLGLIINEPDLPEVHDTQKRRFERVVKYYFPGDAAKSILG
jgi:hypothetical protein